jgi:hypothetical protein
VRTFACVTKRHVRRKEECPHSCQVEMSPWVLGQRYHGGGRDDVVPLSVGLWAAGAELADQRAPPGRRPAEPATLG